jgi:hypothetical protein
MKYGTIALQICRESDLKTDAITILDSQDEFQILDGISFEMESGILYGVLFVGLAKFHGSILWIVPIDFEFESNKNLKVIGNFVHNSVFYTVFKLDGDKISLSA